MITTLLYRRPVIWAAIAATMAGLSQAPPALGVQINFTGGTVVRNSGPNETTNNSVRWDDVDYYTENGFKLDFITTGTSSPSAAWVGDYYTAGNDVIHAHWATGHYGNVTRIVVTKLDNTPFDLNYFVLTSNTAQGGGLATGNELAYIHASANGVSDDYQQLLPPENWGFPSTQIFLGPQFDNVKAFWFDVGNQVDCFGMDNFYINEAAPPVEPEPASLGILAVGSAALLIRRRCRNR
jgi:hypothetical protein